MADDLPHFGNIPPGLPLVNLPHQVFQCIADQIDQPSTLENAYMSLGGLLGYGVPLCRLIERRSSNPYYSFSPTLALLEDFARRGGTVARLQHALVAMNHAATRVIPSYLADINRSLGAGVQGPSGEQNAESSHCQCPNCPPQYMYPHVGQEPRLPHSPVFQPAVPQSPLVQPPSNIRSSSTDYRLPSNQRLSNEQTSTPIPVTNTDQPAPTVPNRTDANRGQTEDLRRQPAIGSSTPSLRHFDQNPQTRQNGRRRHSPNSSPPLNRPSNSSRSCNCDKCRLASDPDETGVLTTIASPPRTYCRLSGSPYNNQGRAGNDSQSNSDNNNARRINDSVDFRQVHQRQSQNIREQKKTFCIKSRNDNTHELGAQPNECSSCSQYREEKRNTWPSDRRDEISSLDRHSSSSDGSIAQRQRHSPQDSRVDIEELYSRLSFRDSNGPRQDEIQTGQNGDLNTNELIERLHSLNNRNDREWNAGSRVEGSRQNSEHGSRATGQDGGSMQRERRASEFVFVTFSWNPNNDDQRHLREIIHMCRLLKSDGIRVKIDMDPETFSQLRLNRNDWLDQMTTEAKYVIVCLSPTYFHDTQDHGDRTTEEPQPDIVQLNARYIFNNLRAEFHGNGSRNRRFIPVLFPNSGATADHIPMCMRSTLVFSYPDDIQDIVRIINGDDDDEYRLPYRH